MLNTLAKTGSILLFLGLMIIIGFFLSVQAPSMVGGGLLDRAMNGDEATTLINSMTADQKSAHFWITVIADTAYPIAYGGFMIGAIWRFGGRIRKWFVLPALAAPIVDLMENTMQAIALAGTETVLQTKTYLTPLKFSLAFSALAIVLICLVVGLIGRVLKSRN